MSGSSTARCLVVASDRELGRSVSDMLGRAPSIEPLGVIAAPRALAAPPACDVLIVCDEPGRPAVDLAAELAAALPHCGVVALTAQTGVDTYRTALAAGVRGVVGAPPSPAALTDAVSSAARAGRPPAPRTGAAIAVAGACGGVGASAVALSLAQLGGGVLVDLGHGWRDLGALADAPVSRSVTDLVQVGGTLSGALEAVLAPAGNARLLAAAADPAALELVPAGFGTALVRELRRVTHAGILDTGRLTAGVSREALVAADSVLIVVNPDLRSCLAARALLTAAARWGAPVAGAEVIVNRWSRRAEISQRTVEHTVGCPIAAVVHDRPARMAGYDAGALDASAWQGRGPFRALEQLSARIGERG